MKAMTDPRSLRARIIRKILRYTLGLIWGKYCWACGRRSFWYFEPILWEELISATEFSAEWVRAFDLRDGSRCLFCYNSLRTEHVARTLVREYSERLRVPFRSFRCLCQNSEFRKLKVAEINGCDKLHAFLRDLPHLKYSEYGSGFAGVPSEDLTALSYPDREFDLVITSDSLEHVPDFDRSLREIRRVLKPGGLHVFTIPVVWDRPSRKRAYMEGCRIVHILPPVHHGEPSTNSDDYLAFNDFGADVLGMIERNGFQVRVVRDETNKAIVTLVTTPSSSDPEAPLPAPRHLPNSTMTA